MVQPPQDCQARQGTGGRVNMAVHGKGWVVTLRSVCFQCHRFRRQGSPESTLRLLVVFNIRVAHRESGKRSDLNATRARESPFPIPTSLLRANPSDFTRQLQVQTVSGEEPRSMVSSMFRHSWSPGIQLLPAMRLATAAT